MPVATVGKKRTKADQRREQQRLLLFGEVRKEELWSREYNGWCWVPRTMPLILHAIRSLSKGASAAETYFALWSNCVSESIVEMTNKHSLIASAGYTGPSSERTWKERMRKLEQLGFIKIASGQHGDISCVLLLNPHKVLKKHKEARTPGFDQTIYNCILEQIANYGMTDFDEPKKPDTQPGGEITAPPLPPAIASLIKMGKM